MRKTRFISLLFLAWSIAFFFVAEFRQGLQAVILALTPVYGRDWQRVGTLSPNTLDELARRAEEQRDARTLAFVALHLPTGDKRSLGLARRAAALDPRLTWIYARVYFILDVHDPRNTDVKDLIAKLQAWDPDNAFPYLLEGQEIVAQRRHTFPYAGEELLKETAWRDVMQRAFTARRYDSYARRRFEFERDWLREQGRDNPVVLLRSVSDYSLPGYLNINRYADLLVKNLGKEAEETGRLKEALQYYWTVAHLGERMQLQSSTSLEEFTGARQRTVAYERLVPLLRRMDRGDEAASLEYVLRQLRQRLGVLSGQDPLAQSSNYWWGAVMVALFAGLVVAFGALTILCVAYVNLKRWVRTEKKGRLYQLLTVAENYMPVLLFLACSGLYVSYYPYGRNFQHYMTAGGEITSLDPLFFNVFPFLLDWIGTFVGPLSSFQLPLGSPFRPYVWYALAGLALAIMVSVPFRGRGRR